MAKNRCSSSAGRSCSGLNSYSSTLLLDEPSLGLAPSTLKKSYEKIKGIRDKYQTAMLIVEHNVDAVFSIADRVYVMVLGKVVAEDVPANLTRERLKGLFMGGE